jgi:transcriptional regulator with XRE-family HTH domain
MSTIRTPRDFGALLKGRRLELGENQAEFARRIRKTQSWVSDVERGATPNIYLSTVLEVFALAGFDLGAAPAGARPAPSQPSDDGDLALDFPDERVGFAP